MPTKTPPKKKRPSGAEVAKKAGRRPVMTTIPDDEYAIISEAADADGRSVANLIRVATLAAAKTILENRSKKVN